MEEFPSARVIKLTFVYKSIYTVCGKASHEYDRHQKEKLVSLLSKSLFKIYILFTKFSSYSMEICKEFSLNLRRKSKTFS